MTEFDNLFDDLVDEYVTPYTPPLTEEEKAINATRAKIAAAQVTLNHAQGILDSRAEERLGKSLGSLKSAQIDITLAVMTAEQRG